MIRKIMFVCHGNICRSPMAECIAKHILSRLGLIGEYTVESSATSTEEIGNPIYPPAKRELYRRGILPLDREARQISPSDYDRYDLFVLMDSRNQKNIMRHFPSDPDGKIHLLMSYVGEPRDVSDPWYSGDFATAFDDISKGVCALLKSIDFRITDDLLASALNK